MSLDAKDVETLRTLLLKQRRAFGENAASHREAVSRSGHLERGGNDRGDESSQALESGIEMTQAGRASYELALVDDALERLERGEFGTCQDCGGEIGRARLLANPVASRCLDCQARHEEDFDERDATPSL